MTRPLPLRCTWPTALILLAGCGSRPVSEPRTMTLQLILQRDHGPAGLASVRVGADPEVNIGLWNLKLVEKHL